MSWVITKSYIETDDLKTCTKVKIGSADLSLFPELTSKDVPFKMFDDDNNLYYEGFLLAESEDRFSPLDEFGMPNAGCTYIKYKNNNGKWEIL